MEHGFVPCPSSEHSIVGAQKEDRLPANSARLFCRRQIRELVLRGEKMVGLRYAALGRELGGDPDDFLDCVRIFHVCSGSALKPPH
jgi:hypothetical protein